MKLHINILIYLVFCTFTASSALAQGLYVKVEDAWVKISKQGIKDYHAFFTVHNTGIKELTIVSVESKEFVRTEFHNNNGNKLKNISVKPGENLQLRPDGVSVLLKNSKQESIKLGDVIPLKLKFSDGNIFFIDAEVKKGVMIEVNGRRGSF